MISLFRRRLMMQMNKYFLQDIYGFVIRDSKNQAIITKK